MVSAYDDVRRLSALTGVSANPDHVRVVAFQLLVSCCTFG